MCPADILIVSILSLLHSPALDRTVVNGVAAFLHAFLKIALTQ